MNLNQLTNFQLYEIIQNAKLDKHLKSAAQHEYNLREVTGEEIGEIVRRHNSIYQSRHSEPLSLKYKMVALVIPFLWVVHVLITSRYPARGQRRKWNEYWLCVCFGLLLWTIAIIVIGRHILEAE